MGFDAADIAGPRKADPPPVAPVDVWGPPFKRAVRVVGPGCHPVERPWARAECCGPAGYGPASCRDGRVYPVGDAFPYALADAYGNVYANGYAFSNPNANPLSHTRPVPDAYTLPHANGHPNERTLAGPAGPRHSHSRAPFGGVAECNRARRAASGRG